MRSPARALWRAACECDISPASGEAGLQAAADLVAPTSTDALSWRRANARNREATTMSRQSDDTNEGSQEQKSQLCYHSG